MHSSACASSEVAGPTKTPQKRVASIGGYALSHASVLNYTWFGWVDDDDDDADGICIAAVVAKHARENVTKRA